jgi:small ligand-binding sensory domain FIST
MGVPAASFEVRTDRATSIVEAVRRTFAEVTQPGGALVFCTGKASNAVRDVAHALATDPLDAPVVILGGPGVLSERAELEQVDAATGLVWAGRRANPCLCETDSELTTEDLQALLPTKTGRDVPTALFIRSERFDPEQLWGLRRRRRYPMVFGAGIHGDPGIVCVDGGAADTERVKTPKALALPFVGLAPPTIRTAHSCRLLHAPMKITKADGAMIQTIDDEPALSVLERLGAELEGQPLVFTVLAAPNDSQPDGFEYLVRGIQGIDPDRRSLLISQELRPGMRITFAVRDAAAARADLDRHCRQTTRDLAGAAPRFALYFNCSGRGVNLHGSPNVDVRVLKEHFGSLPMAGFQSAFEIGSFADAPALQLYTGILAVFSSPS